MTSEIYNGIFRELKKKNISVQSETLKAHFHQGFMSSVSVIESNIGKLIVHVASLVREHEQNKVWEKFSGLAALFPNHPAIPVPHIYYAGLINKKFVLVQKFSDGVPAGKRILKGDIIIDEWSADRAETVRKILLALASVHKVSLSGFDWPTLESGVLAGGYPTWRDFFETETPRWVRVIAEVDAHLGFAPIPNLTSFTRAMNDMVRYDGTAALVHGDAINPSNILVKENGDIVLLDWEWSIIGDPAWEFGDLGWWSLLNEETFAPYFEARNIISTDERRDFLKRAKLAGFFWLLWGTHMHGHDEKPDIYLPLRKLLVERMAEAADD